MNSGLKRFKSVEDKEFFDVVNDIKEVDVNNFGVIRKEIMNEALVLKVKNEVVLESANVVDKVYPDVLSQAQLRILQDDPLEFRIAKARGDSRLDGIESSLKNVSSHLITLVFHFKGLIKLNDFLVERYNKVALDYKDMRVKYLDSLKQVKELELKLKAFEVEEVKEFDEPDSELVLTDEELGEHLAEKQVEVEEVDEDLEVEQKEEDKIEKQTKVVEKSEEVEKFEEESEVQDDDDEGGVVIEKSSDSKTIFDETEEETGWKHKKPKYPIN